MILSRCRSRWSEVSYWTFCDHNAQWWILESWLRYCIIQFTVKVFKIDGNNCGLEYCVKNLQLVTMLKYFCLVNWNCVSREVQWDRYIFICAGLVVCRDCCDLTFLKITKVWNLGKITFVYGLRWFVKVVYVLMFEIWCSYSVAQYKEFAFRQLPNHPYKSPLIAPNLSYNTYNVTHLDHTSKTVIIQVKLFHWLIIQQNLARDAETLRTGIQTLSSLPETLFYHRVMPGHSTRWNLVYMVEISELSKYIKFLKFHMHQTDFFIWITQLKISCEITFIYCSLSIE